jgi:hypothetical protein
MLLALQGTQPELANITHALETPVDAAFFQELFGPSKGAGAYLRTQRLGRSLSKPELLRQFPPFTNRMLLEAYLEYREAPAKSARFYLPNRCGPMTLVAAEVYLFEAGLLQGLPFTQRMEEAGLLNTTPLRNILPYTHLLKT